MSYLDFILIFLCIPIVLLILATIYWRRIGRRPFALSAYSIPKALALISFIAFIYTTPWDNHLISERIWWYDPQKVIGVIWYVPIEEYAFFVLQVILSGLTVILAIGIFDSNRPYVQQHNGAQYRIVGSGIVLLIWMIILILEQSSFLTGRYLGLLLLWYLPPLALQLAFGADILWPHRKQISVALIALTTYLAVADGIAINMGIWTINPNEIIGLKFFNILPLEELLFFLITNALIVCSIPLCLAPKTWERLASWFSHYSQPVSSIE